MKAILAGIALLGLVACADSPTAVQSVPLQISAVAVGPYATCAIGQDSEAYCWGGMISGVTPWPSPISRQLKFASIFMDVDGQACAITGAQHAYCWGAGAGVLMGDINAIASEALAVNDNIKFSDIAISSGTCALTAAGDMWCWGPHELGGTCNTSTSDCWRPRPIPDAAKYRELSGTNSVMCGLTNNGAVDCWGIGVGGQQYQGGTQSAGHVFTSVSRGFLHTCGIAEQNAVYCWGENSGGQLGVPYDALPVCNTMHPCSLTPVKVSGSLEFKSVSAGYMHTCALTLDGTAYCWGDNINGELGTGTASDDHSYTPVRVASSERFAAIAASEGGHTCALTLAGKLYCWGNNVAGQVSGDASVSKYYAPTEVNPRLLGR